MGVLALETQAEKSIYYFYKKLQGTFMKYIWVMALLPSL